MKALLKFAATMLAGTAAGALFGMGLTAIGPDRDPLLVPAIAGGIGGLLIALLSACFLYCWNEPLSNTGPTLVASVFAGLIVYVAMVLIVTFATGRTPPSGSGIGLIMLAAFHSIAVGLGTSICGKLFYETSEY